MPHIELSDRLVDPGEAREPTRGTSPVGIPESDGILFWKIDGLSAED